VILLDTNAAIWLALDSPDLGRRSRRLVAKAAQDGQLAIGAIKKGRLRRPNSIGELRHRLLSSGTTELPLTGEIAISAGEPEGLHNDPADRFIAATAIIHQATLMTADDRLLRWRHPRSRENAEL
jgi:PIN domain nuclease of toxin-antitoxin system